MARVYRLRLRDGDRLLATWAIYQVGRELRVIETIGDRPACAVAQFSGAETLRSARAFIQRRRRNFVEEAA